LASGLSRSAGGYLGTLLEDQGQSVLERAGLAIPQGADQLLQG
jgi:hypothetical protein